MKSKKILPYPKSNMKTVEWGEIDTSKVIICKYMTAHFLDLVQALQLKVAGLY